MDNNHVPAVSICIPAYRNVPFLKRLLDSIQDQTFTDYEVVITDDSPDDSVRDLVDSYALQRPVRYFRNQPALGTPENWNEGIRRARGTWIKLMHNDDWFTTKDALQEFYNAVVQNPRCSFFFSAFQNVTEGTGETEVVRCNWFDRLVLWLSPLHLFRRVYVGNPSCTMVRRDTGIFYDRRFKYVVDFEYYIRCILALKQYHYIDRVLLNIGFHSEQVTKYTFLVPDVQIPENFLLLEKMGHSILRNLLVYDYYWRMFRNLNIRDTREVEKYYLGRIHPLIRQIISFQRKVPPALLRNGLVSKSFMLVNYLISLVRQH